MHSEGLKSMTTMISSRRSFLFLCGLTALAGCPDGGGSATTALTHDTYTQSVATAFCDALLNCDQRVDVPFGVLFDSTAECADALSVLFEGSASELAPFLADGSVTFNADRAASCLSTIAANPCTNPPQFDVLCTDVYTGNVAAGGDCVANPQCAPGTYCLRVADACPGTCTAQKAAGESCQQDTECLGGTGSVGSCFAGQCGTIAPGSTPAAVGAACGLTGSGPDYVTQPCVDGSHCKMPDDGETGTCTEMVATGATCTQGDVCADSGGCVPDASGAFSCVSPKVARSAGAACGMVDGGVTLCDPFAGLDCSEDDVCVQVSGDGTEGAMCEPGFLGESCNDGLYCNYDTKQCTAQVGDGEACMMYEECRSGVCDVDSFTCRAPNACGE